MPAHLDRARQAARSGYSIAENVYVPSLYEVRKPDGTVYHVDATGAAPACNCPASVACCKHVGLVEISLRFVAALTRKATPSAKKARTRRHFSVRHLQELRRLAPSMAAVKPVPPAMDPERRTRIRAMMLADFGQIAA